MKRIFILILATIIIIPTLSAQLPDLETIMQGKDFVGNWVESVVWSLDSNSFYYFYENNGQREIYQYHLKNKNIKKIDIKSLADLPLNLFQGFRMGRRGGNLYSIKNNKILYAKRGDLFIYDLSNKRIKQLTVTQPRESNPFFGRSTSQIYYTLDNNLYFWNLEQNTINQITYFKKSSAVTPSGKPSVAKSTNQKAAKFYRQEEKKLFKEFQRKPVRRGFVKSEKKLSLSLKANENISDFYVAKGHNHIFFMKSSYKGNTKRTEIPHFVTRSGYTKTSPARAKAAEKTKYEQQLYIANLESKKIKKIQLPVKNLNIRNFLPSPDPNTFLMVAVSNNRRDGYILLFELNSDKGKVIYHIHNEAWLGYLSLTNIGWLNEQWIYFNSEEDGYAHLFKMNIRSGQKLQLTKGKYVTKNFQLSKDKKYFYFSANKIHPGNQNLYRIDTNGRNLKRMTLLSGQNQTTISPNFKHFAILHSQPHQPWELYLSKSGKTPQKIKSFSTKKFQSYKWTNPEIVTFKTKDGTKVYSRLYVPPKPLAGNPGIIFIHGAGYLQNAHYGWSTYFREYMFNCKLQEAGYHVMDVDYSGSAGYGANFRTRIYRHMGGKDLDDIVSAAQYLRQKFAVQKVGIYGGSYGGFLAIMGMFTKADYFTAGAALRPVTDWAHYSNWYSGNILNDPLDDPEAYSKSSPIYFAEGLKGHLLMCHGMMDSNVHFQDSVRLAQRLIELGKDNWELAVYPVEGHSFKRPSSWTDEYKRIWKLFEKTLK